MNPCSEASGVESERRIDIAASLQRYFTMYISFKKNTAVGARVIAQEWSVCLACGQSRKDLRSASQVVLEHARSNFECRARSKP